MDKDELYDILAENLPPGPVLYEQLAEEAVELAHAALKIARIMRDENPTPVAEEEARKKLVEEYTDVILVADFAHLYTDKNVYVNKLSRWTDRIIAKYSGSFTE